MNRGWSSSDQLLIVPDGMVRPTTTRQTRVHTDMDIEWHEVSFLRGFPDGTKESSDPFDWCRDEYEMTTVRVTWGTDMPYDGASGSTGLGHHHISFV